MKNSLPLSLMLLFAGVFVVADEPTLPTEVPSMFLVTVAEYEIKSPDALAGLRSPDEMLEVIQSQKLTPIETLRATVVAGKTSMVTFSKRVQRVTGTLLRNEPGNPARTPQAIQQRSEMDIGTMLQMTVNAQDTKIWAEIKYEAARYREPAADEKDEGIRTSNVESMLYLDPGKPRLIGSLSGEKSSYIFLTINPLH